LETGRKEEEIALLALPKRNEDESGKLGFFITC
jgi:hypothetical protein